MLCWWFSAFFVSVPCQAAHPDDPPIKAAIEKGVAYLKTKAGSQFGGYNALCVYAMLKAKVKASDPGDHGRVGQDFSRRSRTPAPTSHLNTMSTRRVLT
ncbi:MAG: hypothetical protein CM1200mP2_35540 [Planctomycetaceae bacterium]|nr:MAG: hypothetical protein CM1200mP2_35540 [Planctomycetaceae bacterium]